MKDFLIYFLGEGTTEEFANFTLAHFLPILILVGVILLIRHFRGALRRSKHEEKLRYLLAFMLIMFSHIFHGKLRTMALRKARKEEYKPVEGYLELEMYRHLKEQNIRAWNVMLEWLLGNAAVGLLQLVGMLDRSDLLMLTVFYFLCDYICILIFCPFQTCLMKNKCCVNCRIYDWGHFMMFTPMLFIPNFYSWSLFFTSIVSS